MIAGDKARKYLYLNVIARVKCHSVAIPGGKQPLKWVAEISRTFETSGKSNYDFSKVPN